MTRLYDYKELDELPPASPGIAGMAQAARSAVCNAYHRYPQVFMPLFVDTPVGQMYQAMWDKVCPVAQRPPSMPLPSPLPGGGQCPVFYRVSGTIRIPAVPEVDGSPFANLVLGPVQGVVTGSSAGAVAWYIQGASSGGDDGRSFVFSTGAVNAANAGLQVTSIVPEPLNQPGLTGSCLTDAPPRQYPGFFPELGAFVLPPAPSPVPGPLAPPNPPTIVRPRPRLPLPIPRPFAPFVQVDIGPFNFQFDIGGVDIDIKPDVDITYSPSVDININLPGSGSSGGGGKVIELPEDCGCGDKLKELGEKVESLRPKFMSRTTTQLAADSTGGNASLPPGHVSVRFVVTDRPANSNEMSGSGGPDVFFPGWFSFSGGAGQGGVRTPIDFLEQAVFTPIEATYVSWTVKKGYRVSVFAISRTPPSQGTWARGEQLYFQV